MVTSKNNYLFLLIFLLSLSFCSTETNPVIIQGESNEIYPLAIGNKWKYSKKYFNENSTLIKIDTFSNELDMSYKSNGIEWFEIKYSCWQISKQSDGIWFQHTQAPNEPTPNLVYKYPTFIGESYSDCKVLSTNEIVKTELGYFRTIHYRFKTRGEKIGHDDCFLSPGIGLVKRTHVKSNSSGKPYIAFKEEILKYNVN